ncbi:hypothetical protein STINGER_82 [Mycobacterium phage Stinger]|uniref:Uncharacterized protein n=1 Tax=Mycobacterium phage Stinger TaxID=1089137 RepID=G8I9K3_9CAUD|nr:hypothetical protein STINGER_82 [Mycobacterium phage Stinger]AER49396.1 hypothetical protein STINGER_82 [Mycobacterium phage Stinger]
MVNLLPGPTRDAIKFAERAVLALERIADAVSPKPDTRLAEGLVSTVNPEPIMHLRTGCDMELTYRPEPMVWCNSHNVELPVFLDQPVSPLMNDEELAALRAKLEGK